MRSKRSLRNSRPAQLAAGAMVLVIPSSAVALAAGQADAQSAISINLNETHIGYGKRLIVSGSAPSGQAGQAMFLQFAPSGSTVWRTLSSATVQSDGHFRFVPAMKQSGQLRAVPATGGSSSRAVTTSGGAGLGSSGPSAPAAVAVSSELRVHASPIAALSGGSAQVRGRLLPGVSGRRVTLDGRLHGRWHVLASSHTSARGGFDIRFHPTIAGAAGEPLRVQFSGDRLNTRSSGKAGRVTLFHQSLASWYNDGGSTACGFHAGLGVANKSLPCGTKVTFRYGGRTVTAVVDDRGPYVGGREWDLNQNTAGALGFGGVGMVWSTA